MTTVKERIDEMIRGGDFTKTSAALALYEQQAAGEVRLRDPAPPRSFGGYLLSLYSFWYWLVVGGLGLMVLSIYVFPSGAPFSWLRAGLGFITSLYLPGYTFIEALYPKQDDLEELERFGLSVGLSIALTPLVGFILNYTPWGIRLDPITASITLLTLTLGLIGVYRKFQYHMLGLEIVG